MKTFILSCLIIFSQCIILEVSAQASQEKEILSELLSDFLAGASVNDAEMHNRFWAEDLIYTGSAGTRTTKPEIMEGLRHQGTENDETPVYHAEDVQIQLYGETAVVAFRLVATFEATSESNKMQFYNTGTFLKRNGDWKAVAWQATRIPDEF